MDQNVIFFIIPGWERQRVPRNTEKSSNSNEEEQRRIVKFSRFASSVFQCWWIGVLYVEKAEERCIAQNRSYGGLDFVKEKVGDQDIILNFKINGDEGKPNFE